ncbi:MAG: DUF4349 domain-containing protein [Lachnospiraceae bacterium]|nr:DUF4349 domain-containing protein [Lachnospiraceae bacterium]
MKKYVSLVLVIITTVILSACSAGRADSYEMTEMAPRAIVPMMEEMGTASSSGGASFGITADVVSNEAYEMQEDSSLRQNATQNAPDSTAVSDLAFRKLIRDANLNVETEEFDFLLSDIQFRVESLGGYMENFNTSNNSRFGYGGVQSRNAYMTIRIPADSYDSFINMVSNISNVLYHYESIRDVTLQYADTESRKEALEVEHDRLLELLARAESIEDILLLEQRMSEVRYHMEWLGSQLKTFDNLVAYSTVSLSVQEVTELTIVEELSFGEKIRIGFSSSLRAVGRGISNFFIWLFINSPFLVIWAVIITAIVFTIRFSLKKSKVKNDSQAYQVPPNYDGDNQEK